MRIHQTLHQIEIQHVRHPNNFTYVHKHIVLCFRFTEHIQLLNSQGKTSNNALEWPKDKMEARTWELQVARGRNRSEPHETSQDPRICSVAYLEAAQSYRDLPQRQLALCARTGGRGYKYNRPPSLCCSCITCCCGVDWFLLDAVVLILDPGVSWMEGSLPLQEDVFGRVVTTSPVSSLEC